MACVKLQIDRQRHDVHAERRAVLQASGDGRQGYAAAARTMPSIAFHAGHHGAHHREVDLVVTTVQHLIGICQHGLAMRAGGRFCGNRLVGMAAQWTATPFATQAAGAWSDTLGLLRLVRLLTLRWRQAGIVRCLRRFAEPGFECAITRAVKMGLCTCAHSARIKASFSASLRRLSSGSWVTSRFRIDSVVTVSNVFYASRSVGKLPLKPGSSRYP